VTSEGSSCSVENILAGRKLYDVWNVNQDAEYHESDSGQHPHEAE